MVNYSLGPHTGGKYIGGIVFVANSSSNDWTFKIRLKATNESQARFFRSETWYTDRMFPLFQVQGPRKKDSPCGANPSNLFSKFSIMQMITFFFNHFNQGNNIPKTPSVFRNVREYEEK